MCDLELVLIDVVCGFGNGCCLLVGLLCELVECLESVDVLFYNGVDEDFDGGYVFCL